MSLRAQPRRSHRHVAACACHSPLCLEQLTLPRVLPRRIHVASIHVYQHWTHLESRCGYNTYMDCLGRVDDLLPSSSLHCSLYFGWTQSCCGWMTLQACCTPPANRCELDYVKDPPCKTVPFLQSWKLAGGFWKTTFQWWGNPLSRRVLEDYFPNAG